MSDNFQSIRGMRDIYGDDAAYWRYLENLLPELTNSYGYEYIKFPILEKTGLFKRSIGDATDIVEKEMYTFLDNGDESLSMRPEGTAVCVRAGIQNGLLYNQRRKLWYMGPMFRRERPQKGRYRQFEQFGVEVFGIESIDVEVELILFCHRLWQKLGIDNSVSLNINTIGDLEARERYKLELVNYLSSHEDKLDNDSKRRLSTNPLRILDSKSASTQECLQDAPVLYDFLSDDSKARFTLLQELLRKHGIVYTVKPTLVRGLDYYNDTVFEWSTNLLGAKSEVCAGGRYDNLVQHLGGASCAGFGFAIGMDRIVSMMQQTDIDYHNNPDIYILSDSASEIRFSAMSIAEQIRDSMPWKKVVAYAGSGDIKKQFKEVDKLMPRVIVILGDKEHKNNTVMVKFLGDASTQKMYTMQEFNRELLNIFE